MDFLKKHILITSIIFIILLNSVILSSASQFIYINENETVYSEDFTSTDYDYTESNLHFRPQITFEFSDFPHYSVQTTLEDITYFKMYSSDSVIIYPKTFRDFRTEIEMFKTVGISNSEFVFYYDSNRVNDEVYARTYILTENLDNISISNQYVTYNFEVVNNIIYINDSETELNVSETDQLEIRLEYLFNLNIFQISVLDSEDYNLKDYGTIDYYVYYDSIAITRLNNVFNTTIINNEILPIYVFGFHYDIGIIAGQPDRVRIESWNGINRFDRYSENYMNYYEESSNSTSYSINSTSNLNDLIDNYNYTSVSNPLNDESGSIMFSSEINDYTQTDFIYLDYKNGSRDFNNELLSGTNIDFTKTHTTGHKDTLQIESDLSFYDAYIGSYGDLVSENIEFWLMKPDNRAIDIVLRDSSGNVALNCFRFEVNDNILYGNSDTDSNLDWDEYNWYHLRIEFTQNGLCNLFINGSIIGSETAYNYAFDEFYIEMSIENSVYLDALGLEITDGYNKFSNFPSQYDKYYTEETYLTKIHYDTSISDNLLLEYDLDIINISSIYNETVYNSSLQQSYTHTGIECNDNIKISGGVEFTNEEYLDYKTNDNIVQWDNGSWVYTNSSGYIQYGINKTLHENVLYINDTSSGSTPIATHSFTQTSETTIEFYWLWDNSSVLNYNYFDIDDNGNGLALELYERAGNIYVFDGGWSNWGSSLNENEWYHFKIEIDCSIPQAKVYLNGILQGTYSLNTGIDPIYRVRYNCGVPSYSSFYIDGLGISSNGYTTGSNWNASLSEYENSFQYNTIVQIQNSTDFNSYRVNNQTSIYGYNTYVTMRLNNDNLYIYENYSLIDTLNISQYSINYLDNIFINSTGYLPNFSIDTVGIRDYENEIDSFKVGYLEYGNLFVNLNDRYSMLQNEYEQMELENSFQSFIDYNTTIRFYNVSMITNGFNLISSSFNITINPNSSFKYVEMDFIIYNSSWDYINTVYYSDFTNLTTVNLYDYVNNQTIDNYYILCEMFYYLDFYFETDYTVTNSIPIGSLITDYNFVNTGLETYNISRGFNQHNATIHLTENTSNGYFRYYFDSIQQDIDIEFWMYVDSLSCAPYFDLRKTVGGTSTGRTYFRNDNTVDFHNGTQTDVEIGFWEINKWMHVRLNYESSSNNMSIYLNGTLQHSMWCEREFDYMLFLLSGSGNVYIDGLGFSVENYIVNSNREYYINPINSTEIDIRYTNYYSNITEYTTLEVIQDSSQIIDINSTTVYEYVVNELLTYNYNYYYLQSHELSFNIKVLSDDIIEIIRCRINYQFQQITYNTSNFLFETRFSDIDDYPTISIWIHNDQTNNCSILIEMKHSLVYFASQTPLTDSSTDDTDEFINVIIQMFINFGVNCAIVLGGGVLLYKEYEEKGFVIGLIGGIGIVFFFGLIDFLTMIGLFIGSIGLVMYYMNNKRDFFK